MAPPTTAERTETAGAGSAAVSPRRLMSPLGYVVVVAIMSVTAGVVYFATRNFHDTGQKSVIHEAYEEIDLGQVTRELAPDANLVREQFMIKIVLLLNPNNKNLAELKPQVEKRRNLLKHIVMTEIIYRKSDAELRNPDVLEILGNELRQRLNAEFDTSKGDPDVIHKVIFPDSRLPAHH
jgi:flagellar basal body-associated protein FliL